VIIQLIRIDYLLLFERDYGRGLFVFDSNAALIRLREAFWFLRLNKRTDARLMHRKSSVHPRIHFHTCYSVRLTVILIDILADEILHVVGLAADHRLLRNLVITWLSFVILWKDDLMLATLYLFLRRRVFQILFRIRWLFKTLVRLFSIESSLVKCFVVPTLLLNPLNHDGSRWFSLLSFHLLWL
jgi:hypothetical protein